MNNSFKKYLPYIGLILLLALGGTYYFFSNLQKNTTSQKHTMNNNSAMQSSKSYKLEVTSDTSNIQPKQLTKFSFRIKDSNGEIFKKYEVAHEKIMHFIAVRKDLAEFLHLHPDYNETTGEFSVNVNFPENGSYRLFPDFTPGVDNPDKLPMTLQYDVEVGNISSYYAQNVVPDTASKKKYGEYDVVTTFPKDAKKQQEITFSLNISKNGKPVTKLENYLGALGHSVILKEGTLDFIHTHALEAKAITGQQHGAQTQPHSGTQNTTGNGPEIKFATQFPDSGVYKIFTQFQHQGEVQTVDYIVKVN